MAQADVGQQVAQRVYRRQRQHRHDLRSNVKLCYEAMQEPWSSWSSHTSSLACLSAAVHECQSPNQSMPKKIMAMMAWSKYICLLHSEDSVMRLTEQSRCSR